MIPAKVFELNDGTALAVYAILAKHANQDGACWPSMKRLEECLGWTETRIRPALKSLIDAGIVAIEKRKLNGMDQSNLYRITANVQVPHHKVPVPHSKAMGTLPQGSGYLTTGDEQEPIELDKEITTPPNPQRGKRATSTKVPIPDNLYDLIPEETLFKIAREQAMTESDLRRETDNMIDHFQGKGDRRPDWIASWRAWMRSPYRKARTQSDVPHNKGGIMRVVL